MSGSRSGGAAARSVPISTRNATFQQWQALLTNRTKRTRLGQMLVQGVRPVTLALESALTPVAVLHDDTTPTRWADDVVRRAVERGATPYRLSGELLAELAEKDDGAEVVLVVEQPADDVGRLPVDHGLLTVVLDRPSSPGNVGSITRSVDAFGGTGVVVCGHACDPYEPRAVRASTGSVFSVPTVRLGSPREVLEWVEDTRERLGHLTLVGTDEEGAVDVDAADLTGPTVLVTGNETRGLSAAWREACDVMVRIPIVGPESGSASSLNAANATAVVLYEASRQRRTR